MDASVFTIGLYNSEENCIEFPSTIEKGEPLPAFFIQLSDDNRLATWCFKHRQDVIINDYSADYGKYISLQQASVAGDHTESIVYLPLWNKEKEIGVISAQAFGKNAYTDYHINILRNLATYSAIALENADAYRRLTALLDELKATQDRMITQSKLASLGELTAGIVHEIQNPLNFVNNFSEINEELLTEMKDDLVKGNIEVAIATANDAICNQQKILLHGKRADAIVKWMLQHSRSSTGVKQPIDINALADEYLRLAYHGLRAKDKSFYATMHTDFDHSIETVPIIPQDIGRVILNLINNPFYVVDVKKKQEGVAFEPIVSVRTKKVGDKVFLSIKDNGNGIPQNVLEKIFQPFFTTKPTGQGTGLGLSISYDIVKAHGEELIVDTKEGQGSDFTIILPAGI